MHAAIDAVAAAYRQTFGSRAEAIAVHGSAVTGDMFPRLSDIDFAVVLDSPPTLRDCEALAARIDTIDIDPFAYVQCTYHETSVPMPTVVPGTFSVLHGDIREGFLHTERSLRSSALRWLEELPRLIDQDMKDWSVAVARRPRQLRLIFTRLKPTVRADLVMRGDDVLAVYGDPWRILADRLQAHEPQLAMDLSALLSSVRASELDLLRVGTESLLLLRRLARLQ